jgi:hypothetical protein
MNRDLLGVINCLGPNFPSQPSFYDLFVFGLGALFAIILLSFWYSRISQSNNLLTSYDDFSIYEFTSTVFQNDSVVYAKSAEREITVTTKLILIVCVVIIITTPFTKLLGIELFI